MAGIKILLALTLGIILFSCKSEHPDFLNKSDVVDFDYQIEGDCSTPVLEVILENKTLNADSYLWDFGDGTTSNHVSPKKVYPKSGSYTIKLTAYFSDNVVQIEKQISIIRNSDGTGPSGQISFQRSNSTSLELSFEITTEEPVYTLSFGDGSIISSSQKVIKHQYAGLGRYSVLLVFKIVKDATVQALQ
jgi:PKD repeat protein